MSKKHFSLIGAGLVLLSLILWFAVPAIKAEAMGVTVSYSFLDLTFGKSMDILGEKYKLFKFSIPNLITLLLLLSTLAICTLNALEVNISKVIVRNPNIAAAVFPLLSGIMVLLVKVFTVIPEDLTLEEFSLTPGTIIIAILLFLSAGTAIFKEFFYDKVMK